MAIVSYVPALFVDPESANFPLVRAMFGLLFIVAIVYVIAVLSSRSVFSQCRKKISGMFARRQ
jgi:cytochrome bd-type quinol oxidase subunit 2